MLKNNSIMQKLKKTLMGSGILYLPSEEFRLSSRIDSLRRRINKKSSPNERINDQLSIKQKIKRILEIELKNPSTELYELRGLLELQYYFTFDLQMKENEIKKKRDKIIEILKKEMKSYNLVINKDNLLYDEKQYELVKINKLDDFRKYLLFYNLQEPNIFYRGQTNINWPVEPSIYRNGWIESEDIIIRQMQVRNPEEFINCKSTLEILTIMQHYNAPTRLLDLTMNPYIALFFACENSNTENEDIGQIIFFNADDGNEKFFDSDTVTILSNIALMKNDFNVENYPTNNKSFNEHGNIPLLLHQIRQEKSSFLSIIDKEDLYKCLFVKVKQNNRRIINQQGLFLLVGMNTFKTKPAVIRDYLRHNSEGKVIYFYVNSENKEKILEELELMNINQSFIYPEIEKTAEYIKNKLKNNA